MQLIPPPVDEGRSHSLMLVALRDRGIRGDNQAELISQGEIPSRVEGLDLDLNTLLPVPVNGDQTMVSDAGGKQVLYMQARLRFGTKRLELISVDINSGICSVPGGTLETRCRQNTRRHQPNIIAS
jgi:hypothetical protein